MKADDAEEDPQATINTTTGLKKGESLCNTVKQEICIREFKGDFGYGVNQAQGLSCQAELA